MQQVIYLKVKHRLDLLDISTYKVSYKQYIGVNFIILVFAFKNYWNLFKDEFSEMEDKQYEGSLRFCDKLMLFRKLAIEL